MPQCDLSDASLVPPPHTSLLALSLKVTCHSWLKTNIQFLVLLGVGEPQDAGLPLESSERGI